MVAAVLDLAGKYGKLEKSSHLKVVKENWGKCVFA